MINPRLWQYKLPPDFSSKKHNICNIANKLQLLKLEKSPEQQEEQTKNWDNSIKQVSRKTWEEGGSEPEWHQPGQQKNQKGSLRRWIDKSTSGYNIWTKTSITQRNRSKAQRSEHEQLHKDNKRNNKKPTIKPWLEDRLRHDVDKPMKRTSTADPNQPVQRGKRDMNHHSVD